MDRTQPGAHITRGLLLLSTTLTLTGCGAEPLTGVAEGTTAREPQLPGAGGQDPGENDNTDTAAFYTVLTSQILETRPDVDVTEIVDEDGGISFLLDDGYSVGSVSCRCGGGSTGVCVGMYPMDGTPATCTGTCDDAGTSCSWINRPVPGGLAIEGSFGGLGGFDLN